MNNFNKFLEELDIKGHSAIPGEGEKRPGEPEYLKDVESRAKERLGISGRREGQFGDIMHTLGRSAMELAELSRGHEKELEKLAEDTISKLYKPIIDAYEIKLDIKLVTPQQMQSEQQSKQFFNKKNVKEFTQEEMGRKPVIRARGFDFSMLIHEAVKGIWLVLSSGAIPKDKQLAAELKKKITYEDEPEDWRYGPEIAADLRDFINENPKVDLLPNVREEFWKVLCDEDTMKPEEFLELIRGILSKTNEARIKVDKMIDSVYNSLKRWHEEWNEYQRKLEIWKASQAKSKPKQEEKPKEIKLSGDNFLKYRRMSRQDLEAEIQKAIDDENYEFAKVLTDLRKKRFDV